MTLLLLSLLIIPCFSCFFWLIVHALMASRVSTFWVFSVLIFIVGLTFIADIGDVLYADPRFPSAYSRVALALLAPCIIPFLIQYLDHVGKERRYHTVQFAWLVVPSVLFSAALVLCLVIPKGDLDMFMTRYNSGEPGVVELYRGTTIYVYYLVSFFFLRVTLVAELAVYLFYVVSRSRSEHLDYSRMWRFLRDGGTVGVQEFQIASATFAVVVTTIRVAIPWTWFYNNPWTSILWVVLFTLSIFTFCYFALFGALREIRKDHLSTAMRFNYSLCDKARKMDIIVSDIAENSDSETLGRILSHIGTESDIESLDGARRQDEQLPQSQPSQQGLASAIFSAVSKSWEDDSLRARFQHLMIDEELFLQPGLTLSDISDRLHSNKTYVSKMVNNTYNLSFPEVLNILRIDYAEQYILSHEGANQEEIAKACGFQSASSFNSTFKRITGYTPRVWYAKEHLQSPSGD